MSTYMSRELQDGFHAAQRANLKKKSRLRVVAGQEKFSVLRISDTSFALDVDDAPRLRGLVDIYDGGVHLYQALIVASEQKGDEIEFEFKRSTVPTDAPALDFEKDLKAPIALLTKDEWR